MKSITCKSHVCIGLKGETADVMPTMPSIPDLAGPK